MPVLCAVVMTFQLVSVPAWPSCRDEVGSVVVGPASPPPGRNKVVSSVNNTETRQRFEIKRELDGGTVIGSVSYTIKGDAIHINVVEVNEAFRRRGVLGALLDEIAARHPDARVFSAELGETNFEIFKKAYKSIPRPDKGGCAKAVVQTPLYRAIARSTGARRITYCRPMMNIEFVVVTIEK